MCLIFHGPSLRLFVYSCNNIPYVPKHFLGGRLKNSLFVVILIDKLLVMRYWHYF